MRDILINPVHLVHEPNQQYQRRCWKDQGIILGEGGLRRECRGHREYASCRSKGSALIVQKTPFSVELARLNLLDLTIPFQDLQKDLWSLTKTLPIILLNLPTISARFCSFYANLKDGEDNIHSGLDSVLQLHHALFETCLGEALPHLPETVNHLLRVGSLRALDPKLVERTFSTFSLIIRSMSPFLLKPTPEARQTLRSTWISVKPYLRPKQNKKYVRKCVADAWAGVIRKARGEGLHGLMDILLEDEEAGMEAVWTNSLKGTANHLHSRAMPIVNILLDRLVENSNTTQIDTLNLVLTAIVHHCSSSSLSPIIEAVIVRLRVPTPSTSASDPSIDVRSTAAMLSVLSTLLFVRKGKRFPEVLLKPTMTKLEQLSAPIFNNGHADDNECRRAWMLCVVGCLQSGKLAHWLNPGVKLINEVWSRLVSLTTVRPRCGRVLTFSQRKNRSHLQTPSSLSNGQAWSNSSYRTLPSEYQKPLQC